MALIYLIINRVNNKKYVGLTTRSLEDRWMGHVYDAQNDSICLIHRAIKKYGLEAFERKIIEECENDKACDAERHWIEQLDTFMPNGYNMTKGGDGSFGRTNSPEERAMRSRSASKRFMNPLERAKMSKGQDFKKRAVKQLTLTDDLIDIFPSIMEAERRTGIGHIKDCCHGRRNKAGGFKWIWA